MEDPRRCSNEGLIEVAARLNTAGIGRVNMRRVIRSRTILSVVSIMVLVSLLVAVLWPLSDSTLAASVPTVETRSASSVSQTAAFINGRIVNSGGATILERRFDWGTTSSCADGWTASVGVSGDYFSYYLTGLNPGTTYHFRAWAKNSAGWGHGNVLSFTTSQAADTTKPVITSLTVTPSTATLGSPFTITFSVTDSGGSGLKQVELWRANDSGGSPGTWAQITSRAVSGNSYSGSFSDAPSSSGSYWYGIHAVDNANNWGAEPTPVKVTVTSEPAAGARIVITSRLRIDPEKDRYYVSDLLTARFRIQNAGSEPIMLSKLVVGGRLDDGKLPDDCHPDFSLQSLTLGPGKSHDYEGTLEITKAGNYHFFCAYQTPDGEWNTSIDLDPGLTDGDRVRSIIAEFPKGPYVSRIVPASGIPGDIVTIKGVNLCEVPPPPEWWLDKLWEELWGQSYKCEVVFDGPTPRNTEVLSSNAESGLQEITVKVPAFDLRWSRDKSIYVHMLSGSSSSGYKASNKVQFTFMEPKLEGIDPPRTMQGRSIRLTGNYLGDGESGTPYFVKFGAGYFYATRDDVNWSNTQIDMGVPPVTLVLGGTDVAQVVRALMTLKSLAEELGWGAVKTLAKGLVGKVIPPDFIARMPVSDDEGAWLVWFRSLVAELLPGFDLTLDGDLTVQVRVSTPVGDSSPLSFTFTKDWVPINGDLYWAVPSPDIILQGQSPAEFRIYDSQARVTGLVDGIWREDIPNSLCTEKTIIIFNAADSYRYEVVGTGEGTYGMDIFSVLGGKVDRFGITGTPISVNAVHQYSIDWDAFSDGERGVIVQVDSDGDGDHEGTRVLWPPIASLTFSPGKVSVNQRISFDASQSYDADGEIVRYDWSFGDGNTATGELARHAYSAPGEFFVSLVVVDNDGVVSTHSRIVQVTDAPDIPIWLWLIIITGMLCLVVIVVRGIRRLVEA